jgi:heme iron utilization protein
MTDALLSRAAGLLTTCKVAALATVDHGAPAVSMVPYALDGNALRLLIMVSRLAAHTADLQTDERVAMMIMEAASTTAPHTLARVSLRAVAIAIARSDATYGAARDRYCAHFPDMTGLFALDDFALYAIRPTSLRVVAGFARAATVGVDTLERHMFASGPLGRHGT